MSFEHWQQFVDRIIRGRKQMHTDQDRLEDATQKREGREYSHERKRAPTDNQSYTSTDPTEA